MKANSAKTEPEAKKSIAAGPAELSPLATLHRERDKPELQKWVEAIGRLLPGLSRTDAIELSAAGAGMSVAQRDTLLAVLVRNIE